MMERRQFLQLGLAAGAGLSMSAPNVLRGASGSKKANKLNVAQIGAGGRGARHWRAYAEADENIVALCDVDSNRASEAFSKFDVPKYKDYRAMLEDMGGKIDAVSIATPDHTHHQIAKHAIKMGKHVYLEKPLVQTIPEGRELRELAQKHGVMTQMGNQGHTLGRIQMLKEWIDAGLIGDVREVHVWTNRPVWPQGAASFPVAQRIPDHMAWGLWLGGKAHYPYNEAYAPFSWRGWYAFGTGSLGDMGCHQLDGVFYALELGNPSSVVSENSSTSEVAFPKGSVVNYQFPKRGQYPALTLKWFDGDMKDQCPKPKEMEGRDLGKTGCLIYGDKGTIHVPDTYYGSFRIVPEKAMQAAKPNLPKRTLDRPKGNHFTNFTMACKGEIEQASSNFEYSVPLTEMVLLGAIAQRRPGKQLKFDSDAGRFVNDSKANQLVHDPVPEYTG
jgi:predicted dehydrogenase